MSSPSGSSATFADLATTGVVSSKASEERPIDYVLVWEESQTGTAEPQTPPKEPEYRKVFEDNLRRAGVEVVEEASVTSKKQIHFLKLFVTWDTMCQYAETLSMRVPVVPFTETNASGNCRIPCLNLMSQSVPKTPPSNCTDKFNKANMPKFLGIEDRERFFRPTQRHRVAYQILATRVYGAEDKGEIGIDRLLKAGVYSCAYPLHEGPHSLPDGNLESDCNPELQNRRQILHAYWASYGKWYKVQPLDHVREYFGEKIAFYFAFLGLYTTWLVLASMAGLFVFLWGCFSLLFDPHSNEACNSGKEYRMCPKCSDGCEHWYLSDVCGWLRLAVIFDASSVNYFFAVFASCWAVLFLEYWKRENAALAHRWKVNNLRIEEERPRPGYSINCTEFKENCITGNLEPYFPHVKRIPRFVASIACILVMLSIVTSSWLFLTATFDIVINPLLNRHQFFRSSMKLVPVGAIISAIVQLIVLLLLELPYKYMAYRLTEWEMHRTQAEWEDQFILKLFVFQWFNYYAAIFCVALLKGREPKIQEDGSTKARWLGSCSEGGCMLDLTIQMAIVMTGDQVVRSLLDIAFPAIRTKIHRFMKGLTVASKEAASQWEADYALIEYNRLQDDYLKMVLQFGFVTLFVAAFPLAPLLALINNLVEIRLDAWKLVCHYRRPLCERAQGIGVWLPLMQFIACASVVSNMLILAISSEQFQKDAYKQLFQSGLQGYLNLTMPFVPDNITSEPCRLSYRDIHPKYYSAPLNQIYVLVSIKQYKEVFLTVIVVFFACYILSGLVPAVPKYVLDSVRRENHLVGKALTAADTRQNPQQSLESREGPDIESVSDA